MSKILVIGSFVTDTVATMREFPQAGETVLGETLQIYPGGKGANQCVAAARLRGDVAMAGMVGADGNGKMFLDLLEAEGIPHEGVFVSEELPTAVAQVQINAAGQNRIAVIPAANYGFTAHFVRKIEAQIAACELAVLQLELPLAAVSEAISLAKKHGRKVLLNPAPAVPLPADLLSSVDYLTPNETELSILSGLPVRGEEEALKAAKTLVDAGTSCVIATLGAHGALICTKDSCETVPAYRVESVDTVGAGDSFNGALAAGLTGGKTLRESVTLAAAMGALTVTKKGAIPSLHTLAEVLEFMEKNPR